MTMEKPKTRKAFTVMVTLTHVYGPKRVNRSALAQGILNLLEGQQVEPDGVDGVWEIYDASCDEVEA